MVSLLIVKLNCLAKNELAAVFYTSPGTLVNLILCRKNHLSPIFLGGGVLSETERIPYSPGQEFPIFPFFQHEKEVVGGYENKKQIWHIRLKNVKFSNFAARKSGGRAWTLPDAMFLMVRSNFAKKVGTSPRGSDAFAVNM